MNKTDPDYRKVIGMEHVLGVFALLSFAAAAFTFWLFYIR